MNWPERKASMTRALPMMSIVLVSIGGIYVGVFTPTEAAAVGAALAFGYALWRKSLGGGALSTILVETVNTTALVFLILIGALIFGPFLALSGLPEKIAQSLAGLDVPRVVILVLVLAVYIALGTFLEGFSMLVLTLPIVIPIMQTLGYDLIWFGVVMVIVLEMGLIDPPVGINVFIVKGLGAGRADERDFRRRAAVLVRHDGLHRHPDRVPGHRDVHSQHHDREIATR